MYHYIELYVWKTLTFEPSEQMVSNLMYIINWY